LGRGRDACYGGVSQTSQIVELIVLLTGRLSGASSSKSELPPQF
jgi:hypothetical protein